ncbi:hypothetical protein [Pseudoalteromonas sp.]|uniref:hypothetical protein n=1 Tax=Pseudoalteromonas sp. TaxID=53249 RepID=UPI00356429D8
MINTTHLPSEIFGEPTEAEKVNALYRESDYYKELYHVAEKHSISDLFVSNSINRFLVKNSLELKPDDFEQVLNSVCETLCDNLNCFDY